MNRKLMIAFIILCTATYGDSFAGYESTVREEEAAHSRAGNEADITSREEERVHTQRVDNARITENEEEWQHTGRENNASDTSAQENASRGADVF